MGFGLVFGVCERYTLTTPPRDYRVDTSFTILNKKDKLYRRGYQSEPGDTQSFSKRAFLRQRFQRKATELCCFVRIALCSHTKGVDL